jgi:hypothetical protein
MEDILAIVEENYELRQPITDGPLESAALTAVLKQRRSAARRADAAGCWAPSLPQTRRKRLLVRTIARFSHHAESPSG